ncbi:YIP1 family protein [Oscillochloris sp. ZM17-4]|uniref:YIP1 family protein n=1 Tax=Oscillochloris sp. ZM17-4 TaxID=2866714 RepID=UPI001C73D804|nr:YIP1 family protein [Oscillochloris sp. ZM17-4]MBX0328646.1 YIP1 family protein [Oscillochloris sp. ZM17-4]
MSMMQQVSLPEMVAQSRDVISNPSVGTFERYERRGTTTNAAIYVGVASVVAGVLGLTGGLGGLLSGILGALIGFFVFTGMVFYIGKSVAGGTGTWDEVAYTFSLFVAPLTVLGAVISLVVWLFSFIPILGFLVALLSFPIALIILLAQAYFAYIAVQSSMNIRDQGKAIITLGLSVVGTVIVQMIIGGMFAFLR